MRAYALLILVIAVAAVEIRADCWWTGCQLNSWAVVGCEHYGRVETGKKPCPNGNLYNCCTPDAAGGGGGGNDVGGDDDY